MNTIRSAGLSLIVFLLLSPAAGSARAAIALSFTESGSIAVSNGVTNGWAFALSSTTVVTHLGVFDYGTDGLLDIHPIAIWTEAGSLLASATVPSGDSAALVDRFRYVGITPVTLVAGRYIIGAHFNLGDYIITNADITTAPGITYAGSRSIGSNSLTFPGGDTAGPNPESYFGPNFQMNGVPEPSSLMLFVCATVALQRRKDRSGKVRGALI